LTEENFSGSTDSVNTGKESGKESVRSANMTGKTTGPMAGSKNKKLK
jgi:hypothetical protein